MAAKSISMRKFKEILRLRYDKELSQHQIARALNLSVGVVNKYLRAAEAAGIGWPVPEELTETQIRRKLFPADGPALPPGYAQPDFALIHQELKRKGVTRFLLWEEYAAGNSNDHYSYSQFCFHYQKWSRRLKLSLRQTHRAGEKLFVDYAGQTVPVIDSGEIRQAQIFVAVLGASNYTYVEATLTQQLHDWTGSHVRAFEFFGGAPELIVPDNLRSGVSHADRYEPELNRSYQEMLAHYGTTAIPARPRKPRDKAKVEVGVQIVERWMLARLRHRKFFSLLELNQALRELLENLNTRPFKKLSGTRRSQFEALDLPVLQPIPARAYEFAEWKKARVHIDYHVEVQGHFYSVPHSLVTRELDVRMTATAIEFIHQQKRVAVHPRSDLKGGQSTIPDHMPPRHRAHREWDPVRFLDSAAEIGPHTCELTAAILKEREHPQLAYRSCLGLLNLARRYSPERLEAACQQALAIGAHRQSSVRSILQRGLDLQPMTDVETSSTLPAHGNIRGGVYYQ